ncbi:MAG: ATP-grasp fold amidoligase family protein [Patescibacteria group bacterium]|nr:ATP-grasp fold amidoligase family protein [Patescibacteria group bacterium]
MQKSHWELYKKIHLLCIIKNKRFPNLRNPSSFNDKIQWLKLFDQSQIIVDCSDKLKVKDFIAGKIGENYTPTTYFSVKTSSEIELNNLPKSFVIKTNHDSGSVYLIKDKNCAQWNTIFSKLDIQIHKPYGWDNGEWAYSMIQPIIFSEEYLGEPSETPPPDYKFHCANGRVLWLQYIYDRGCHTKEVITSKTGEVLNVHFDTNMQHSKQFIKPKRFSEMIKLAEKISGQFKYIRVDMFIIDDKIFVGELTFYPLMGCYNGNGQKILGKLIPLDISSKKEPIYTKSKLYLDA